MVIEDKATDIKVGLCRLNSNVEMSYKIMCVYKPNNQNETKTHKKLH